MKRPEGFDRAAPPVPTPEPDVDETVAESPVEAETPDPAPERAKPSRESNAKRTDRLLRAAERTQAQQDARAAKAADRAARAADRDRRRSERAELRRFTERIRRRRRVILISVGAVVASLGLLIGLVYSPVMSVRSIEVTGTDRLDAAAIESALQGTMGAPLATVTEASLHDELAAFTGLRSYAVDVVPPSSIVVRVVERVPVLTMDDGEGPQLVDPAGVELGPPGDADRVPALTGVEAGTPVFDAVVDVLVAMPESLRTNVAAITATTPDDVSMTLVTGQQVVWGGADQSQLKADVLAALIASTDPGTSVTFDVSAPEHAVTRP